eukprot:g11565.t1
MKYRFAFADGSSVVVLSVPWMNKVEVLEPCPEDLKVWNKVTSEVRTDLASKKKPKKVESGTTGGKKYRFTFEDGSKLMAEAPPVPPAPPAPPATAPPAHPRPPPPEGVIKIDDPSSKQRFILPQPLPKAVLTASAQKAGEDVDVLLRLEMPNQPVEATARVPVDIICVLDISGSMSMEAKIQSAEGSGGLNLLDVAKHGVKTVMHALQDEDRLALVLFDSHAETTWELTEMTAQGRATCEEKLKQVCTRGATNIWNGLEEGLSVCRRGQVDGNRLAHLILLTDGQTAMRNEVLPRMEEAKGAEERLPCTVSTFGFGYNIDSDLLVQMAEKGFGVYSFIPDAGFVGTIFVNYISNLLSTMALSAMLLLDPEGGEIKEVYGGLKMEGTGNGGKRLDLPVLQYGQSKDVVVRMSVAAATAEDPYISGTATYKLANGQELTTELAEAFPSQAPNVKEVSLQLFRSRFAHALEEAVQMCEQSPQGALQVLSLLSDEIGKSLSGGYSDDLFLSDLLKDLQGEAISAVEINAFRKWGKHYLPSLMFAHRRQMCNNFKEPAREDVNRLPRLLQDLRDEADDKFNQLPPPEPTNRSEALRAGRRVKIRGLVQQAELNGQFGQLLRLDTSVEPHRWLVRMKGQKEVIYRLLPERLRLAPLPKKRPAACEVSEEKPTAPTAEVDQIQLDPTSSITAAEVEIPENSFALGCVCLGQGSDAAGLADLQLDTWLLRYILGGPEMPMPGVATRETKRQQEPTCQLSEPEDRRAEPFGINTCITAPAGCIALALVFLRTNCEAVASRVAIPQNLFQLEQLRLALGESS